MIDWSKLGYFFIRKCGLCNKWLIGYPILQIYFHAYNTYTKQSWEHLENVCSDCMDKYEEVRDEFFEIKKKERKYNE